MNGTRGAVRVSVVMVLVAFLSTLVISFAHAIGANNLTVHLDRNHTSTPHSFVVWQFPTSSDDVAVLLAELAPLTDAQLTDAPRTVSTPVDAHGDARFTGLPDGRYYLRAALPDGSSITTGVAPLVVDLPRSSADGTSTRDLTVHPKPVEPPPAPTPTTPPVPTTPATPTPPWESASPPATIPPRLPTLPPEVPMGTPTGGERFLKVNEADQPLAGAVFRVSRDSGNGSAAMLGTGPARVVQSGPDGVFVVDHLPYGTYQLLETTAPEGYKKLAEPIVFTVDATSATDGAVIKIVNQPQPPGAIPKTGDLSLLLSLAVGTILIGMGIYLTRTGRSSSAR